MLLFRYKQHNKDINYHTTGKKWQPDKGRDNWILPGNKQLFV